MELPLSNIRSAACRSFEHSAPMSSDFTCGIPRRESNDARSPVNLSVRKTCHRVSITSSFHHETNYGNFDKHSSGKKGNIHFIGVGGSGLSALAMLALKQVIIFPIVSKFTCLLYKVCFV